MNESREYFQEEINQAKNLKPETRNPQPDQVTIGRKTFDTVTSFIGLVSLMRSAQKDYFATRNTGKLILAKGYEEDVDAYLKEGILPKKETAPPLPGGEVFNEDRIGSLIQSKVKTQNAITQWEEKLAGMTDHQSEASIEIFDTLEDLRFDLQQTNLELINEKTNFKTFLQRQLSRYNQQLDLNHALPHQREEIAHMANRTVQQIGQIDNEIKALQS